MTVELREKVKELQSHIKQRDDAARITAHRIAKAQADFTGAQPVVPRQELGPREDDQTAAQFVEVVKRQINLIEEVSAITKIAEERVVRAERKTCLAHRQAIIANTIALISVVVTLTLYISSGI